MDNDDYADNNDFLHNGDLTAEQSEKVLQLHDLIGIDDLLTCRDILTRHQWDIEVAIQEQLNLREGRPSMFASASDAREPDVINDRYLQRVFFSNHSPVPVPAGLSGFLGFIVNYVFSFCYNTVSNILNTIRDLLRSDERIVTDPLADVMNFIQEYNEKYPNHPVFYQGTYAQVLNDAKQELRFLAIYIHSDSNRSDVVSFCRNTLANDDVIEYISSNMLFWGCSLSSPEGYRVSHAINIRTYPTLVVVGLQQHKMTIVGRLEGDCTPAECINRLRIIMNENKIWLTKVRQERAERKLVQTIREQQDEAYLESLKADQEKERLKRLEEEKFLQQQMEEEAERLAREKRKEDIAREKIERALEVPNEPEQNDAEAIMLLFILPNGLRLERRFRRSDSLKHLHLYVFCHPQSPDSFAIATNFPKRTLETEDSDIQIQFAGINNREVLYVYDLEA